MLTIDGKQYRNLEEQVRKNKEDIQDIRDASEILNAFGIKVVGQVDTSVKLPNPAEYPGEYGDAYLVGTKTPYDYYIFTRPNDTHPTAYWLNIGEFPLAGPKGDTGATGPIGPKGDGSKWYAGTQNPTIVAEVNDQYLNTTDGSVFSYSSVGWTRIGNIRGPQGVQGIQGIQGPQGNIGPVGPQGPRGDVGGIVNIRGLVDNVNQLPTPASLQNLSIAYLVGANKELYIQIGETPETATWNNMGILNVATYVTVNGQYVNVLEMNQYQNKIRFLQLTGTSGTLTSEQINLLRSDNTNYIIVDNELYNCNDLQDSNGYLVYTHTCADASNNVNIKTLSITLTNNNWSIQTTPVQPKIPVANTNEAVQFAEDERQKSKNLFDYTKAYGYSACSSNNDGSFNISIENFYYAEIRYKLKMKVGQPYSFSAYINSFTSSSSSQVNYSARFMYTDGTGDEAQTQAIIGQRVSFTLTPAKEIDYILFRLLRTGEKVNMSGVVSDIQIEEGSTATDYQPYNGEIVHEKEIKPILIYDIVEKQTPIGLTSSYSNGIKFADNVNIPIGDFNYFNIYIRTKNNVKKKTTINKTAYYWGDSFFGFNENWVLSYFGVLFIIENNLLSFAEAGYTATNASTYTNKNQSEDVVVYRIEGGY